ncbi:hypothetical protein [Bombella favorum]|uniref:hypothetical protein n=1 Tax=Bombella favorum TaxID=2039164 RepID=UPI001E510DE5|nr:hypothetical protein [Bombella favorum]
MKLLRLCLPVVVCSVLGAQGAFAVPASAPAGKMSATACRQAFDEAKKANALGGQKYADFKLGYCAKNGGIAPAQPAPVGASKPAAAPAVAPVASGAALFPARVAPEFASLTPGKARMKTCLAQYNANKSSGRNGSLKWIQKGGGYYSECNARLKGTAQ